MALQKQAHQFVVNPQLRDLNPTTAGYSLPAVPGERNQMFNKNCHLLHYVYTGKGEVHMRGTVYHVHAGQAFLMRPEDKGYHIADTDEPWGLRWVIFTGELAQDLSALPPVFEPSSDQLRYLKDLSSYRDELGHLLASDLLQLYAELVKTKNSRTDHIQKAVNYIQMHYSEDLIVQNIADHVGINRYYLTRIFKEKTGITIQDQLTNVRIFESKRYLRLGHSVQETAYLCGFNDAATYSRLFKKKEGCSPRTWKNTFLKDLNALEKAMERPL